MKNLFVLLFGFISILVNAEPHPIKLIVPYAPGGR